MAKLPIKVQKDIARRSLKANKREVKSRFDKEFKEIKQRMINEFLSHPVTIEILAGPNNRSQRISGTLDKKTNLFAFIGFPSSDVPIQPILEILETTDYKQTREGFKITMPSAEDIFRVTPMPWATGRSWAKGIESGISGLGYLLNKRSKNSRSGSAIQSSNSKVRGGGFRKTTYISSLINKYKKQFKKIL